MNQRIKDIFLNSLTIIVFLFIATVIGLVMSYWNIEVLNVVIVYVFSVLLIARYTSGYVYGVVASIASTLIFNWFFTDPYFTLKVNDPTYFITFIVMSIIAIMTSALTTKFKEAALEAQEKEMASNALYELTKALNQAKNISDVTAVLVVTINRLFGCKCRVITNDCEVNEDGCIRYSIKCGDKYLGKVLIPVEEAELLSPSNTRLLCSIIESASLALERLNSIIAEEKIREEAIQERYRGDLLRGISHDLRTPLAAIMGSGEMLMGMSEKDDPRYDIAQGIYQDAQWLHSLVENILNLTKLQAGQFKITKELEPIEEVIGAACSIIEKRGSNQNIVINMPDSLIMVEMDARLITQVLVNLLDNAIKHNKDNKNISIDVEEKENDIYFSVTDSGTGVKAEDMDYIFNAFYTTKGKSADSKRGTGLGLAICRSIIEAHGGKIWVSNILPSGAKFTFTLPKRGS